VSLVVPVLCLVTGGAFLTGCGEDGQGDHEPRIRANVVVLMTDDQSMESMRVLRRTRRIIGQRGATFSRAFTSFPLCCPSRASFLTGQHAHNNGVQGNRPNQDGGGYVNLEQPARTLAGWMKASGYETAHFGKWANSPGPQVPPGWDTWRMTFDRTTGYYGYRMRRPDRKPLAYGSRVRDYHTYAVTRQATRFINRNADGRDRPMFLSVAYLAPHGGFGRDDAAGRRCGGVSSEGEPSKGAAQPAARDAAAFPDAPLPRPPSFNEADVSDKPASIQASARFTPAQIEIIETRYRCELASLLSVDESVARITRALRHADELGDTYLIFTSDQGGFRGEHRRAGGKNLPYGEAIHVPLLIRGPGLPQEKVIADPVANVDLAPTILALSGAQQPRGLRRTMDGRSLVPVLKGRAAWPDRAVLIEGRQPTTQSVYGQWQVASYQGVRTRRYSYSEHYLKEVNGPPEGAETRIGEGELSARELYDLATDPYELRSHDRAPRYHKIREKLAHALDRLRQCAGTQCQVKVSVPHL
jgi:N-acetylglucosamine-6-sulfatase